MTALPLNRLHFWLATLHPNKIRDEHIREKVLIFQTEAADALFEKFFGRALAKGDVTPSSVGGVVKGVVSKHARETLVPELREMMKEAMTAVLPEMARAMLADRRFVIGEGMTAGDVLDSAGFKNRKGQKGLAQFVSRRLASYHRRHAVPMREARLGSCRAIVFDPIASQDWLKSGGKREIETRIAEKGGQGVLKLISRSNPPSNPAPEA